MTCGLNLRVGARIIEKEQVPQAETSEEGSVQPFRLAEVLDTHRRFTHQRGSQAFPDSGLGLATLWLSAPDCFTLHIKGSLEGRLD